MRYRDGLTTTLAGAAIPYGYTLVVWSSGSVVGERHGPPDLGEIALFFTGASAAYALLRLVVRGGDVRLEHWARRHHIVATSVSGAGGHVYGLLQLSDKGGDRDFDASDADNIRELAALIGETLDALRSSAESG